MEKVKYSTNRRHWAIASALVFIAIGFIDPVGGVAKGENSWWSKVVLLPNLSRNQLGEIVPPVLFYGAMLAIAAMVLGWVIQAVISVRRGTAPIRYEVLMEQLQDGKS